MLLGSKHPYSVFSKLQATPLQVRCPVDREARREGGVTAQRHPRKCRAAEAECVCLPLHPARPSKTTRCFWSSGRGFAPSATPPVLFTFRTEHALVALNSRNLYSALKRG